MIADACQTLVGFPVGWSLRTACEAAAGHRSLVLLSSLALLALVMGLAVKLDDGQLS
jgi:putative exporter of polyketide antibiotics